MARGDWMPGATVMASSHDAGTMLGGNSYATWHSFESDPKKLSATAGGKYLVSSGNEVHLVFNPISGQVVQLLPGSRAGRGLRNLPGGAQTNRAGRVNIQIEVIGFARSPWTKTLTDQGEKGLARILAWLDLWGVPRDAPAGQPCRTAAGRHNRLAPGPSGHYAHSQWKENEHWDHGGVLWADIFAVSPTESALGELPKPKPPVVIKPAPAVSSYSRSTVVAMQRALRANPDGAWGPTTDAVACHFRNAAYPAGTYDPRVVQRAVGVAVDGVVGPKTRTAILATTKTMQRVLGVLVDGDWGAVTDNAFYGLRSEFKGRY